MRVAIFGRGKVGSALARQLRAAQVELSTHSGRAQLRRAPRADVLILAVPDGQIAALSERLAPHVTRRSVVLHCAGARGPDELAACAARGAAVAGFHPLLSFASRGSAAPLSGAAFVTHGDARAIRVARRLSRALGARCVVRPVLGPAYHAAAALVANGGAALAFAGLQILLELGLSQAEAEGALASLLQSVAFNVRSVGLPAALTGPVVRRDEATVAAHRAALRALLPRAEKSYAALQPLIRDCAEAQWRLAP